MNCIGMLLCAGDKIKGGPTPTNKPSKEQLEKLAEEIKQDQSKTNPAEKRVKLNMPFKKAVKKIAQTSPPKKKDK